MSNMIDIKVPDMGDFSNVDVIEILAKPGDRVEAEDPIISVETEKASMDVPSPQAGIVKEILVETGSSVSTGDVVARLETDEGSIESTTEPQESSEIKQTVTKAPAHQTQPASDNFDYDMLVLGSGPGGYTAAFRSADLGMKTAMVERFADIGGVCLNVGCIPSKALLHAAKIIDEVEYFKDHGLVFGEPKIELDKLRNWKQSVVKRLTGGLSQMANRRNVDIHQGIGRFTSPHQMEIKNGDDVKVVSFKNAIIAAGSQPARIPGIPYDDPRVIDSTGALELTDIPKSMLVIGGGIIGLEMATVYEALGVEITVVELMDRLIPGCDRDLVRPLEKRIGKRYKDIFLETMVKEVKSEDQGLRVVFEGKHAGEGLFDRVLVAVGRRPNGPRIGAEAANIEVNDRGFVPVDQQQRTNVPHIFAIGDIAGEPMLAHKATHEGKVAAEAAFGMKTCFEASVIPSVAYTDPEVAWVGLTEEQAKKQGIAYGKGAFPWAASGRSLALGRDDGMTKLLFCEKTDRILGAGAVGPNAGELIAEAGLAIEMGCDATDIGLTIHAHPTLSETMGLAAEAFEGTITDLYIPKKKKKP